MGIRILDFTDGFTSATSPTELDVILPLTTKGDLLIRDNTEIVRFPVGTNGQFLQADSTQDEGMIWANRPANFNYVINGNFDFWQRGTSLSAATGARYLADRWRSVGNGSTVEPSRQSFTTGQTDVPGEPIYFHRAIVSSSTGSGNNALVTQRIENVRTLAGQTVTVSFWAKADSSKNISIEFAQSFGTGGSPSSSVAEIGVSKLALTASWQKFEVTANIPTLASKTIGTDENSFLEIIFWLDAGSNFNSRTDSLGHQSGTFDIAQVKLEIGSYATEFSLAGGNLAGELVMCQRYYEKSYSLNTPPGTITNTGKKSSYVIINITSGNFILLGTEFKTEKRAIPTVNIWNPVSGTANVVRIDADSRTATISNIGTGGFSTIQNTSGVTWNANQQIEFQWVADAEL